MNRLRTLGVVVAGLAWLPAGMDCAYAADGEKKADGLAIPLSEKTFSYQINLAFYEKSLSEKSKAGEGFATSNRYRKGIARPLSCGRQRRAPTKTIGKGTVFLQGHLYVLGSTYCKKPSANAKSTGGLDCLQDFLCSF